MFSFIKIYKKKPFQQIGFVLSRYSFSVATGKSNLNYYQILGIGEKATAAEIKKAFHQKAKEHHPDIHGNDASKAKESEEKFKIAVEAYKILSDEMKRKEYDETIKPKVSKYNQTTGNYQQQSTSSQASPGSRTRYSYEKFYGDENIRENMYNTQQSYSWQQNDHPYQNQHHNAPPPNQQHEKKKSSYFQSMNYEYLFLWGLGIVFVMRWVLLTWETENAYKRTTFSEVEHLNPFEAEDEGIYVDIKLPKDSSKPLTLKDIKGLSIEQLEEIDRMGYTLPATAKEKVMDYRETYKLYKKQKAPNYWNYNKMYEARNESQTDISDAEMEPVLKAPRRKKKTMKEAADEVKKDIIQGSSETSSIINEKPQAPEAENPVGAAEVKIPRMKANLYNLEKNR